MDNTLSPTSVSIQNKIYTLRGEQVMIDRDLAELYGVDTSHLNRQVKRNSDRFPSDFMFQVTQDEFDLLRCQNVTANWNKVRYLPFAFTEEGVATLASVLKSSFAAENHVAIMRAFVTMRRYLTANAGVYQRIEKVEQHLLETDHKIDNVLDRLEDGTLKERAHVFSAGKIYDAKAFISELIATAKREVILIDGYIGSATIHLLDTRADEIPATIYTKEISEPLRILIKQHNQQYKQKQIQIKTWRTPQHDRWLIIDNELWHCGSSIKDAGTKAFGIDLIGLDVKVVLTEVQ